MDFLVNYLIIIVIFLAAMFLLYQVFHRKTEEEELHDNDFYELKNLEKILSNTIDEMLMQSVQDLNLSRTEMEKRENLKRRLRNDIRESSNGNNGARDYVKEYIKEVMFKTLNINEETIDFVIPFDEPDKLKTLDKFQILLHLYKKKYDRKCLEKLFQENGWDQPKTSSQGKYYEITEADVKATYQKRAERLSYGDKVEILAQRMFEDNIGNSVVDLFCGESINMDGFSGGIGGITKVEYNYLEEVIKESSLRKNNQYDNINVMYKGKTIRLSCLSFGNLGTLKRVVKNLSRNNAKQQLTEQDGAVTTYMEDDSRVTACRPPANDGWSFYVRKFNSVKAQNTNDLITDQNSELPILLLKGIILAEKCSMFTGDVGSGKTTLLKNVFSYINPTFNIRVAESVFEMHLNKLYPYLNIQSMREAGNLTLEDILRIYKKTDTDVAILGEIDCPQLAGAFVELTQSGGKFTLGTSHHKTTDKLISYFRNALLNHYSFQSESIAEEQVVEAINFDLHMAEKDGHRYIERITQIVPVKKPTYENESLDESTKAYYRHRTNPITYELRDVVVCKNGKYEKTDNLTKEVYELMLGKFTSEEKESFIAMFS